MKVDPLTVEVEAPRGKRGRRHRDDEAPKAKDDKPPKWKEREGFFQGARVRRK